MMTKSLTWAVFIAALVCVTSQKIALHEHKQSSSQTDCDHGLLNNIDTAVFTCDVDVTEDVDADFLYIQTQGQHQREFHHLCEMRLKQCVDTDMITCEVVDQHIWMLTIRVGAKMELSGAKIRVRLVTSNQSQITSDEQFFPIVKDPTDAAGQLVINGKKKFVGQDDCEERIDTQELKVEFNCTSVLSPCWVEISASDSADRVQNKDTAVYYRSLDGVSDVDVTIRWVACSLQSKANEIRCKIKAGIHDINAYQEEGVLILRFLNGIFVVLSLLPYFILFLHAFRIWPFGNR